MSHRRIYLLGILFCALAVYLTGCYWFRSYKSSEDTPNMLAEELKLRKNYWYILDLSGEAMLFYNDFQDYFIIFKLNDGTEKNIIYSRNSLNEELETFQTFYIAPRTPKFEPTLLEKLPPECKGICAHFIYKGKKAMFFDIDALKNKYKYKIFAIFINDGKNGFGYSIHSFHLSLLPCDVPYYRILQAEPDFHLLDFSSVKNRYNPERGK